MLVLGDFNMPPDSAIYRRCWSDFSNAFDSAGFGFGSTHFTHRTAVRIDHVLAGPGWRFRRWLARSSALHTARCCRRRTQDRRRALTVAPRNAATPRHAGRADHSICSATNAAT